MEIFDKVAVGDVRDEFYKHLKEKMEAKYQHLEIENERISEQQCQMYLQQNYDGIAAKLQNKKYEGVGELVHDIKDFLQYF